LSKDLREDKIGSLLEMLLSQAKNNGSRKEAFWSLLRLRGIGNAPSRLAEAFFVRKILA
jgi:hypothetical protein